jgi:hypothetical protein
LAPGAGLGRFGRLAAGLPAGALATCFALGELAFVCGLLGLEARSRAGFDLGLGRSDDGKALFAPLQLQREIQRGGQRCVVGLLGQTQQFLDFAFELLAVPPAGWRARSSAPCAGSRWL